MIKWIKEHVSDHAIACTVIFGAVLAAYLLGTYVQPGWISYAASLLPLGVISITAIARGNDIRKDKVGKRWQFRRAGLSIVAAASFILMLTPLANVAAWPTWTSVALYWGFALTWFTTPEMPPWWRWISGDKQTLSND